MADLRCAQTAEIIGWAGRVWGAKCPYQSAAFFMQIICLIIGEFVQLRPFYTLVPWEIWIRPTAAQAD